MWSQKLICFVDFEGRHIFPTAIRIDVVNPEADLFVSGNRKPEKGFSLDLNKQRCQMRFNLKIKRDLPAVSRSLISN